MCDAWQRLELAEREGLTMKQSRQLFWQGQRGEFILVPLHQAHLLPAKHKALSHHHPITPNNQRMISTNAAGTKLDLFSRRRGAISRGVSHCWRLGKPLYSHDNLQVFVWRSPTSHTFTQSEGKGSTHSPCQTSSPRLIRVKQTLAEHQSILNNLLQRWLLALSLL